MDFLTNPSVLLTLGFVALVLEIMLGVTTILMGIVGLALIVTSLLLYSGILPQEANTVLLTIGVLTGLLTAFLWKPLKRLQKTRKPKAAKSDLIGQVIILNEDVSPTSPGKQRFSGLDWTVTADAELSQGQSVKIVRVEVGHLHVSGA